MAISWWYVQPCTLFQEIATSAFGLLAMTEEVVSRSDHFGHNISLIPFPYQHRCQLFLAEPVDEAFAFD